MNLYRDLAPNESHIALRSWGKVFYLPSLFHLAPTHDRIVPLFIHDILRSRNILEVYGAQGLEKHNLGYIMVGNHPVQHIRIFGRVLWYSLKDYDTVANSFVLMTVDDSSGENLTINVKIKFADWGFHPSMLFTNAFVEVVGTVAILQDYQRQIVGTSIRILGKSADFEIELACWEKVLATRSLLKHAWVYHRESSEESGNLQKVRNYYTSGNTVRLSDLDGPLLDSNRPRAVIDLTELDSVKLASTNYANQANIEVAVIDSQSSFEMHSVSSAASVKHPNDHDVIDLTIEL